MMCRGDAMHGLLLINFAAAACLLIACSQEQPVEALAADRVLANGQIYTVGDTQSWAETIVVNDGKSIYVGDNAGAEFFLSEEVETTDFEGHMVIPALSIRTHPGFIKLV